MEVLVLQNVLKDFTLHRKIYVIVVILNVLHVYFLQIIVNLAKKVSFTRKKIINVLNNVIKDITNFKIILLVKNVNQNVLHVIPIVNV
jgi:hypothetical protein